MRLVLDASVALKMEIAEPDSVNAIRLREEYRNAIHELIAPESFSLECAHALTKKSAKVSYPMRGFYGTRLCLIHQDISRSYP
jgi:hypothetical protein